MHYNESVPAHASAIVPHADRLRLAVAAYLARFKGTSRDHTDSDLRCYLAWCAEHGLDPFLARRPHLELYPVDAGGPPIQTIDGLQAFFGCRCRRSVAWGGRTPTTATAASTCQSCWACGRPAGKGHGCTGDAVPPVPLE
jgi:hypothetical protein